MVRSLCIASMLILLLIVGCRSEPPADVGYLVLSGANFDEIVLSSDQPVLVDFFATWCPPCKAMAPIVAEVAAEFEGRAVVGQLDIDQNPALAAQYEVEYLPTFILFKHGEPVDRVVGGTPKGTLSGMLEAAMTP